MKVKEILKGKEKQTSADTYSEKNVREALSRAFEKMKKNGVDRLVIGVVPEVDENAKKKVGDFVDRKDFFYYPYEALQKVETDCIDKYISYQVVALTTQGRFLSEEGAVMERKDVSIEVINRIPVYVFSLVNPKRYQNVSVVFLGKAGIEEFAKSNSEQKGISAEEILGVIETGISEYREITRMLMEKAGVYRHLHELERKRFATITDAIFHEMRQAIAAAKHLSLLFSPEISKR